MAAEKGAKGVAHQHTILLILRAVPRSRKDLYRTLSLIYHSHLLVSKSIDNCIFTLLSNWSMPAPFARSETLISSA